MINVSATHVEPIAPPLSQVGPSVHTSDDEQNAPVLIAASFYLYFTGQ